MTKYDPVDHGSLYRGHDPLRGAHKQAGAFNKYWLTNGAHLNPIQRVGYLIFSLLFAGIGLAVETSCWQDLLALKLIALPWAGAGLFFLFLVPWGVINVFRFKSHR